MNSKLGNVLPPALRTRSRVSTFSQADIAVAATGRSVILLVGQTKYQAGVRPSTHSPSGGHQPVHPMLTQADAFTHIPDLPVITKKVSILTKCASYVLEYVFIVLEYVLEYHGTRVPRS